MISNGEYLKKVLFLFLAISLPIALMVGLVTSWQLGTVFGALIGLFMSAHLGRNLVTESFEINTRNKDQTKGLTWYEQEIIHHMRDLRYHLVVNEKELKVWEPSTRSQVMGGRFRMQVTPYSITIEGPRGTVRILKSILDMQKIFL